MWKTIRDLLEQYHLKAEDTVYGKVDDEILDFPLVTGDHYEVLSGMEKGRNFPEIYRFHQFEEAEKKKLGYEEKQNQLNDCHQRSAVVKKVYKGEERKKALEVLGSEKKQLRREMEQIEAQARDAARECFGRDVESLRFFEYKNRAVVMTFSELCEMAPPLEQIKEEELHHIPLLVSGMASIKEGMERGEALGFVGGPCLFGIDEVLMEVHLQNGDCYEFDCSCGRSCTWDKHRRPIRLAQYLEEERHQVARVNIINRKKGITRQEWISLLYLFEIARALKGKIVIPLPDLSYIKYMKSDIAALDEALQEQVMKDFKREAFRITDYYLEVIEMLKKRYPDLEVAVLHQRDEELCRRFYEMREPYIRDSAYMRKLTNAEGRKDAVVDYITMLALPYYFFGIRHVIQVDSLDETDSGRKCQKIHGKDLILDSILYPEFISSDGIHTIYNADISHKEYLQWEDINA